MGRGHVVANLHPVFSVIQRKVSPTRLPVPWILPAPTRAVRTMTCVLIYHSLGCLAAGESPGRQEGQATGPRLALTTGLPGPGAHGQAPLSGQCWTEGPSERSRELSAVALRPTLRAMGGSWAAPGFEAQDCSGERLLGLAGTEGVLPWRDRAHPLSQGPPRGIPDPQPGFRVSNPAPRLSLSTQGRGLGLPFRAALTCCCCFSVLGCVSGSQGEHSRRGCCLGRGGERLPPHGVPAGPAGPLKSAGLPGVPGSRPPRHRGWVVRAARVCTDQQGSPARRPDWGPAGFTVTMTRTQLGGRRRTRRGPQTGQGRQTERSEGPCPGAGPHGSRHGETAQDTVWTGGHGAPRERGGWKQAGLSPYPSSSGRRLADKNGA